MAVRPVVFQADGSVVVLHDGTGHTGTVAFADVRFGRVGDGGVSQLLLELTCPVCGWGSVHPVGGGCDAGRVQLLFARIWLRRAVLLGIPVAERTWPGIKARVRARVEAADGPWRWRLEGLQSEDGDPGA